MYGRPIAIVGAEALSASAVSGKAPRRLAPLIRRVSSATRASGGKVVISSVRSLRRPGRRIVTRRSRTVGLAPEAKPRASLRNGPRRRATGLEAVTSGSTSFSAARRFTKVVLARRMNGGSRSTESASACFWAPSAWNVVLRFETVPERSFSRAASAVTSFELSTRKRSNSGSSRVSSPNRRLPVERAGLR